MKKSFLAAAAVCLMTATAAQAQNTTRFTVRPRQPRTTFVAPAATSGGAVLRASRSGNPAQMVNPAAPAEYGTSQEVTRHEDGDPYQRPQGIKLVTIEF